MKEIDGQLYGYSYELDTTSESDGTKCFAVDTGTVFVAYKGVWYEQPGSFWAASISEGEDDMYKTSWEISKIVPASDLLVINAVDTGARYVSFNGKWYAQPVQWSAPAAGGGSSGSELPAVTSDDDGDVLTVVDGEWGKAAPSSYSPLVVSMTKSSDSLTSTTTMGLVFYAMSAGLPVFFSCEEGGYRFYAQAVSCVYDPSEMTYAIVCAYYNAGEAVLISASGMSEDSYVSFTLLSDSQGNEIIPAEGETP